MCRACRHRPVRIGEHFCLKCGKELGRDSREYCPDCLRKVHAYDRGRALFRYDDCMRASIAAFKYKGRREYKAFFAQEMAQAFTGQIARWQPEVLVPIPLHRGRKRRRGYNQAELLARELSQLLDIPVDTRLLKRVQKTLPQKELSDRQRRENMKTAFKIQGNTVKYKRILLIDDIYTTGSTIDAAASLLKEKGAKKVYFLCISIGSSR
ncbi:MAG: ComF family protein [Lachnospiraceae bacterium]|nr:ComF family protein [Lachnospiraceae bacterium]